MSVNENSSFKLDWKIASVVILCLVAGGTSLLEGGPLVTKSELAAHDAVEQAKFDRLTDVLTAEGAAGTANANQISSTNSQLSQLTIQVAGVVAREADDRSMIDELKVKRQAGQINNLKRQLREKQLASKLDRQSYERQQKAVEGFVRKQAVGL